MAEILFNPDAELGSEGCTCRDPYRVDVCPVHCQMIHEPPENRPMVLTDADLFLEVGQGIQWTGIPFVCQACGKPALLHFMDHCGACGAKGIKNSDSVRDFVDKKQAMYNSETEKYAGEK